jgi:ATP-binding cassette subfamily B protein
MNGTIREIVSFADPAARFDEERLSRALRIACADGFVSGLPEGADTLLGERGSGLSEGQMQRVAIARAVFSDSPLLLLHQATSALDAHTERSLLENLRSMTDKTVVIVTHRPAALSICDRVLEFSKSGESERHA